MKTLKKKTKERIPSWDELKEMYKETDRMFKETDRKFQESWQQMQKTSLQMQETDRKMQETDRQMQQTDKQVDKTCKELHEVAQFLKSLTSQTGHIIEGLMEPSAMRMFQERGYNINRCWKNFKRYVKELDKRLEVDLLLLDDEIAIIVEVKTNCTCKNIDHFVSQMQSFKDVCPEYADKNILLAIAAINYDREAIQHAHKQGLFVIRVTNDNIFTLDSTDGDTLLTL